MRKGDKNRPKKQEKSKHHQQNPTPRAKKGNTCQGWKLGTIKEKRKLQKC